MLFLLALFAVPFATALVNLFIGLALIGFIPALATSAALRKGLRSPPGLLALALLALYVLACTWSIAPAADMAGALKKYARLLVLPVGLALNWRDPHLARDGLRSFLGGAAVLTLSCYLVWLGMMPTSDLGWWRVGEPNDAYAFKNHITVGILLGFSAALSTLFAVRAGAARRRALWAVAALLFTIPIIFLGQGRTGYIALFVGLACVCLLRMHTKPRTATLAVAALVGLFAGFYHTSDNFKSRTDDLVAEIRTNRAHSPNGVRLSFMLEGLRMAATHPLIGQGTGAFAEAYAPTAQRVWAGVPGMSHARHQPHSEFLLVAVQLGLLGLVVYFAMLGSLMQPAVGARTLEADALAVLGAVYIVTSSFNSLLWDTTEAYWFLMLSSCLYAGAVRARPRV